MGGAQSPMHACISQSALPLAPPFLVPSLSTMQASRLKACVVWSLGRLVEGRAGGLAPSDTTSHLPAELEDLLLPFPTGAALVSE